MPSSPDKLSNAIKTDAEMRQEALSETQEQSNALGFQIIDDYFSQRKEGKLQTKESEEAIVNALNHHPEKEKLVKYLQKTHGIFFETQVNEHGGEGPESFEVISIKGDDNDEFGQEELTYLDTKAQEVLQQFKDDGLLEIVDWGDLKEEWQKEEVKKEIDNEVLKIIRNKIKGGKNIRSIKRKLKNKFNGIFVKAREEVLDMDIAELTHSVNSRTNNVSKLTQIKQETGKKRIETEKRVEKKLKRNEKLKDEVDALNELKKRIPKGRRNLKTWEIELNKLVTEKTEKGGTIISEEIKNSILKKISVAKAKLQSVKTIFTREEEQKLFAQDGGSIEGVDVDLTAASEAGKYAVVFSRIENAGFWTEEEKEKKRQEVAETLGIKLKGRPENASQLKSQMYLMEKAQKEGKVDKETGKPIEFDKEHPIVMNESPKVIVYPFNTGYVCEAIDIENLGQPIRFEFPKGMPDRDLNNQMNRMFIKALFGGNNMSGALEALTGEGREFTGAVKQNMESKAVGDSDMVEVITQMFLGQRVIQGSRFLKINEMKSIRDNMRWLVPDGTFGVFNLTDSDNAQKLMSGLGFGNKGIAKIRMKQAGRIFQGRVGAKTYQLLYDEMHPNDKKSGYEKLRKKVGDDFVDQYFGVLGKEAKIN